MKFRHFLLLVCCLLLGCKTDKPTLTLATTTSTRDSGLMDVLQPMFEKQTGVQLKVVAVGTGQALALGRRGDADVLLTHAPDAEKEFVAQGYAKRRRHVMHNDFVLLGPKSNPADVVKEKSIAAALAKISQAAAPFVSRGDDSGTHRKEKKLWKLADIQPQGRWYIEAGDGMAAILRIASEKRAYTLSDRGTYLAHRKNLQLEVLYENDLLLENNYAVMVVNPQKHLHVNYRAAEQFAEFLLSPAIQKVIAQYGVEKYGQPLFFVEQK